MSLWVANDLAIDFKLYEMWTALPTIVSSFACGPQRTKENIEYQCHVTTSTTA